MFPEKFLHQTEDAHKSRMALNHPTGLEQFRIFSAFVFGLAGHVSETVSTTIRCSYRNECDLASEI